MLDDVVLRSSNRPITVLVCLDAADIDARPCLEAVLRELAHTDRLFVVDSGSADRDLIDNLEHLHEDGRLVFEQSPPAAFGVDSVALAYQRFPDSDIAHVDARVGVPQGWLPQLRAVLADCPESGTVSAISNAPSPMRYPNGSSHGFSEMHLATVRRAAMQLGDAALEVPLMGSTCMLFRRECLAELLVDRSLGAITSFSALSDGISLRGWRHLVALRVYAYLIDSCAWSVNTTGEVTEWSTGSHTRSPSVSRRLANFLRRDPLRSVRRFLDEALLKQHGEPIVLILTHARGGGVDRFVAERCSDARRKGLVPLICRAHELEYGPTMLWTDRHPCHDLVYSVGRDEVALSRLLRELPIQHIELQHFLGLSPSVVESCLDLGLPYDIFIHDYIWICPRITLIGPEGRYCGEPRSTRSCNQCVRQLGREIGESITTADLRRRSKRWLSSARHVFVPTNDVASRLARYFPETCFETHPLESDPTIVRKAPRGALPIRVGLIGALGRHKGYDVLLRCARYVKRKNLPIEFVLIGSSSNDGTLKQTGCVSITGAYAEPEAPELLARENLDVIWLPSVWPETWSYTLTHAVATGLPIVAFKIGAIAERIQALQCGILCQLNLSTRLLVQTLQDAALQGDLPRENEPQHAVSGS